MLDPAVNSGEKCFFIECKIKDAKTGPNVKMHQI